ncbi:MAG TPA: hypothetical protein DEU95_12525 [Chloroflexi bacterium]|nr:hypothetical protein [Chloroflexota bacterium]
MFCSNCGAKMDDGSQFCASCGQTVASTASSASSLTASQSSAPPVYQASAGAVALPGVEYAGFLKRFAAILIDDVILVLATILLVAVNEDAGTMIAIVLWWLYFALQESSERQATIGKRALGIIVTDLQGERVTFARATGRFFSKYLSGVIFSIGYIMAAFTSRKQALHDLLASTLVVNK